MSQRGDSVLDSVASEQSPSVLLRRRLIVSVVVLARMHIELCSFRQAFRLYIVNAIG